MPKKKRRAKYSKEFLTKLRSVTAKRAKTVIDHILKNGQITTEELKEKYGYNHPPRAAADVKEEGIPLEMFKVVGSDGRKIAAYRFGDPAQVRGATFGGRKAWPKNFKARLIDVYGSKCAVCSTEFDPRYLQIDHRVPYHVAGDMVGEQNVEDFMLLCGSCNRAKSWSCEHCINWTTEHDAAVCQTCYWAKPDNYAHISLRLIRRLDITWAEKEVPDFERLRKMSKKAKVALPDFVKSVLKKRAFNES